MVDGAVINAYLRVLSRRLPSDIVDELRDGLLEEYEHLRTRGLEDATAARQAMAEFGEPGSIVREFVAQSRARRAARAQLVVGPVVGLSWSLILVAGRAWTWPVPVAARSTFAAVLLLSITAILAAATARTSLRRARLAIVGILASIVLDAVGIGTAWIAGAGLGWLLIIPVVASSGRMAASVRELPRLLVV
jgi:hypothetical protein